MPLARVAMRRGKDVALLTEKPGLRPENAMIVLVEVKPEN